MNKTRKTEEVSDIIVIAIVKNQKYKRKRNQNKSMKTIKLNRGSTL